MIDLTFNKPDLTDVISDKYISIKNFGDFYILIVFAIDDRTRITEVLYSYRIYQKLLDGKDISKMKPTEVLKEFMNKFGKGKNIPGHGEQKFYIDRPSNVFFPGILDLDMYSEAVKNL
jgi:hypothetical protein